jgi:Flp pilus assembly pilin Flp
MKKYLMDDSGQGVAEYAMILCLASVAAIAAVAGLGGSVGDFLSSAADGLTSGNSKSNSTFQYQP